MDAYANELTRRLTDHFDSANVCIDGNALSDKIDVDGEPDNGEVAHILNQMVNDWNWLPEYTQQARPRGIVSGKDKL
jgi:hypothetical protein